MLGEEAGAKGWGLSEAVCLKCTEGSIHRHRGGGALGTGCFRVQGFFLRQNVLQLDHAEGWTTLLTKSH